jgi:hypothetical protein
VTWLRRLLMPFATAPEPAAPSVDPTVMRDTATPTVSDDLWWCPSCRSGAGGAWCGRCGAQCRARELGAFNVDVLNGGRRG